VQVRENAHVHEYSCSFNYLNILLVIIFSILNSFSTSLRFDIMDQPQFVGKESIGLTVQQFSAM
jgi:hypothetical protein